MGMFKDLFALTREAKELKRNTPTPSMGEMVGQMRETLETMNEQQGDAARILQTGAPGRAIVREMGTPARDAAVFNLTLDLEVHPGFGEPYRVANEYLVPAAVPLAPGVELPVRIDPADRARVAIDWDNAPRGPTPGQVRPL